VARHGRAELLRLARAAGAPWCGQTAWIAAVSGAAASLEYAVDRGCPFDAARCRRAAERHGHDGVVSWIDARQAAVAAAAAGAVAAGVAASGPSAAEGAAGLGGGPG
jgi:hypothetical protein